MTPQKDDLVRFVRIKGVSSREMQAQVGSVGTVTEVRTLEGRVRVCVRFGPTMAFPTFWLDEAEWEAVE